MSGRRTPAGLAVLAGVLLAHGAGPSPARAAVEWDLTLGAGVSHTDNLHLDAEPVDAEQRAPVSETIFTVNPGARLGWAEGQDHLLAGYRGERWWFSGDEDLDPMWLHDLTVDGAWRRWSPFFVEAGAQRGRVPRFASRDDEALVDQIDRTFLSVRSGLSRELGPTTVGELAYRGERETFSGIDDADRVTRHYAEGLVRHRWSPLWGGEASAAYGVVGREVTPDFTEARVAAALDRRFSERLTGRARLEWVRRDEDAAPDAGASGDATVRTDWLTSAELRGVLERGGFWSLGYVDRTLAAPDGDTADIGRASAAAGVAARLGSRLDAELWRETRDYRISGREEDGWGPMLIARWAIAPWAALDVGGAWARTLIRERGAEEVEDRVLRIGAAVVLLIGKRASLEAGYVYRQNDSSDDTLSYDANAFHASVSYAFGPVPPAAVPASSLRRMVASTALTTSGGR